MDGVASKQGSSTVRSQWATENWCEKPRKPLAVFPGGSDSKDSACSAGHLGSISRLARSRGRGHEHPLQYSCLENPCGQWSLAGYKESDTTERLSTAQHIGQQIKAISYCSAYYIESFRVPDTVLSILTNLNPTKLLGGKYYYHSHFTDEETEAREFPGSPVDGTQRSHC